MKCAGWLLPKTPEVSWEQSLCCAREAPGRAGSSTRMAPAPTALLHGADAARRAGRPPAVTDPSQAPRLALLPRFPVPQARSNVLCRAHAVPLLWTAWETRSWCGAKSTGHCWKHPPQWFLMDVSDRLSPQWRGLCSCFQPLSPPWLLKVDLYSLNCIPSCILYLASHLQDSLNSKYPTKPQRTFSRSGTARPEERMDVFKAYLEISQQENKRTSEFSSRSVV